MVVVPPTPPHYMTREELEAEVLWLRSVVGADQDTRGVARLRRALGVTLTEARLLLTLLAAARPVKTDRLCDILDISSDTAMILISRIRQRWQRAGIVTHQGVGYELSPRGRATLEAVLSVEPQAEPLAPPQAGRLS